MSLLYPCAADPSSLKSTEDLSDVTLVSREAISPNERESVIESLAEDAVCVLVRRNRDAIVILAQERAATRARPRASVRALDDGIPALVDGLLDELNARSQVRVERRPFFEYSLSLTEVIHDYVEVRRAVLDVASSLRATGPSLAVVDWCVTEAIARIQAACARHRERALAEDANERVGTLAHELRNRVSTALVAFKLAQDDLNRGGRSAAILQRSLETMNEHVARACAEVQRGGQRFVYERIDVAELVGDVAVIGAAEARSRGLELRACVEDGGELHVQGDRLLVEDALLNLVQNALRHTQPGGHIRIAAWGTSETVFIEVADECGGLPEHVAHETLFDRFEQHGVDRRGLGLGLTITKRNILAHGGAIRVRNAPGTGCIFVLELPLDATPRPAV